MRASKSSCGVRNVSLGKTVSLKARDRKKATASALKNASGERKKKLCRNSKTSFVASSKDLPN